jgi:siroheme synthase-like protein
MISTISRTLEPVSVHGYPIVLCLERRSCLVVGGGPVALRKVRSLLDAGAVVTVVAPDVLDDIRALGVEIALRRYAPDDLVGRQVAIAATGDPAADGAVSADGERLGVLVNVADEPALCAFTLPAVARRGPVSIAVSTDGASPALATWLRDRLAQALPADLEDLATLVTRARRAIREAGVSTESLAWHGLIDALSADLDDSIAAARATADAFVRTAIVDRVDDGA